MSSSSVSLGRNLVSLKWEDFNMFVVSELAALYQKDDLTDVTLFCEGRSFKAHKVLLSLWSTYFRDVFRSTSHSHPVVILRETNSSDLELILRFIYQGHLLIPIEETDRFLKAAEHFQVAGLKNMRTHMPNYSYSSGSTAGSGSSSSSSSVLNSASAGGGGGSSSSSANPSQVACSVTGPGLSSIPLQFASQQAGDSELPHPASIYEQQHNQSNSSSGMVSPPPPPQQQQSARQIMPPPQQPSEVVHNQQQIVMEAGSNQQQVIRQSSSGRQQAVVVTASGYVQSSSQQQLQVVTRVAPESVIYHQQQPGGHHHQGQQQVVIFPQAGGGVGQYVSREGAKHEMMVVQGMDGEAVPISAVHIEPSGTGSHHSASTSYTVYAHSSTSPVPSSQHQATNSSPEVSGTEEAILGLPYNASPSPHHSHHTLHRSEPPPLEISQHQHHSHHTSSSSSAMEIDSHPSTLPSQSSVVVTHSYAPSSSTSSSSFEPLIQNGNGTSSSTSSSAEPSPTSKVKPNTEPPPVYAVKRIPPPLPPSSPPPSRNFKNPPPTTTSTIKRNTSPKKAAYTPSPHNPPPSPSTTIATRSRAISQDPIKTQYHSPHSPHPRKDPLATTSTSSQPPQPPIPNNTTSPTSSSSTTTTTSSRKVVLVPCPKCGKKVKQTSLKVHMKRTHLEEGTVLVCPICSKRISSKGVYYKHMYIHRKRSEQADNNSRSSTGSASSGTSNNTPASSTLIKNETQGT